MTKRKLIIPDMHIPFQHPDSFDFLASVADSFDTEENVQVGDLIDNCALSQFDSDPDMDSAGPELVKTKQTLKYMFKALPKIKICYGNHDLRFERKAAKAGISRDYLLSLEVILGAPKGWEWRMYWDIDGVRYEHGTVCGKNAALTQALGNRMNTVVGHTHCFSGVQYAANITSTIWGMNVGCLINQHSLAFSYAKDMRNKPTLGCGVIVDNIPIFVPMITDSVGKWVGEV